MYQPPSEQNPNPSQPSSSGYEPPPGYQPPPAYTPPPGYQPPPNYTPPPSQPYGAPPNYASPTAPPPYGTPPPPGYAPPGYAAAYGMPVQQQSSGLAVASLVLGLLSFLFWFFTGIPAVITGHMALNRIKQNPMLGGKGMAIAGLILGYLSIASLLCIGGLIVVGLLSGSGTATFSTSP